jgi:iron-sulfur cluster repair protein YtfE (RIC family)
VDVTRMLEADHRQVEALFAKIEKTQGEARQPLIDELATALRGHMELEESVLYPQMQPVTGKEAVVEATTEHQLARKSLEDLLRLAPDEPGFGAALDATKAGIVHHVQEEEKNTFPQLRKDGSVLEQVATPFMQKRMELGLPMDAAALEAASSKEELATEAQKAGIEGAASMTKSELAKALAATMA